MATVSRVQPKRRRQKKHQPRTSAVPAKHEQVIRAVVQRRKGLLDRLAKH